MARTDIYVYTEATQLTSALITGETNTTAKSFPQVVLGDSETFSFRFTDGSAYASWAGDATYSMQLAVGPLGSDSGSLVYIAPSATTVITDEGWSAALALTTGELYRAMKAVNISQANPNYRTYLHIRVEDPNGGVVSYAVAPIVIKYSVYSVADEENARITSDYAAQAAASANAAAASATLASTKASEASTSESNASDSANAASVSAGQASDSADAASTSATAASNSATAADASATASASSASDASDSADAASASATAAAASSSAAASSATSASNSATDAANAIANYYEGTVAGNSVPSTATQAGAWYLISSAGTSQTITWAVGDMAVYDGTSGNWTKLATSAYGFDIKADALDRTNARATRQGLKGTGVNNSGGYSTLNDQDPAAGDFLAGGPIIVPDDASATEQCVWGFTSSLSTTEQAQAFVFYYSTSGWIFRLYGATTGDYIQLASTSILSEFAAKAASVYVSRDVSGATLSVYINDADRTADFTETTNGTSPGWGGTVTGTYWRTHYRNSTNSSAATVMDDLRLYNAAPDTLAEAADAMSPTPLGAKWQPRGDGKASDETAWDNRGAATNDFATATNGYEFLSANTYSGFTAGHGNNGSISQIGLPGINIVAGWIYRVSFDLTLDTGTSPSSVVPTRAGLTTSAASSTVDRSNDVGGSLTTGSNSHLLTATGNDSTGFFSFVHTPTEPQSSFTASNFKIEVVGKTVGLGLIDGGGYQPKNPRFENGSTHWGMSTSGIDWTVPANVAKRVAIQTILTWAGTHEAKQVTAGVSADDDALIESVILKPTASTSGSGATVGTVNDPDQFVSATALTGGTDYSTLAGGGLTLVSAATGGTAGNDMTFVVDPDTANYTGSIEVIINYLLP